MMILLCRWRCVESRTRPERTITTWCPSPPRSPARPVTTGVETSKADTEPPAPSHLSISSSRRWLIRRTLEDFQSLDRQLHTCVYDRRYSQLPVIHQLENIANNDKVSQSFPLSAWAELIVFPKLLHSKEFLCHTKRERER